MSTTITGNARTTRFVHQMGVRTAPQSTLSGGSGLLTKGLDKGPGISLSQAVTVPGKATVNSLGLATKAPTNDDGNGNIIEKRNATYQVIKAKPTPDYAPRTVEIETDDNTAIDPAIRTHQTESGGNSNQRKVIISKPKGTLLKITDPTRKYGPKSYIVDSANLPQQAPYTIEGYNPGERSRRLIPTITYVQDPNNKQGVLIYVQLKEDPNHIGEPAPGRVFDSTRPISPDNLPPGASVDGNGNIIKLNP